MRQRSDKVKNRIFAIFLVLVLLVEIIPTKVFAAMENPEGAVVEAITDSAEDSSTEGEAALEEPAIVPSEESSAEAVTEDDGTNSTFSDGSEATATNGSNTANTESTVEQTDTSVEAGTEENGNQTEATDSTEGSTDNTEGSTDNTQESTDTTGGSTDTTGGSTDSTGGSTDTTGGSTDSTGGSTDTTGGSTDTTGGSTDTTGGSTDNTGESTTDPSEPTPTTSSTIKVEKEGNNNGTVKLIIGDVEFDNADLEGTIDVEEGKTITIVATPTPSTETDETRSYVSQILINDQAIGLENYIKYEEYRKENITLQGDTTVKVTFATDYKVEATAQAGTQITLTDGANSDNNTSTTADKPKAELMIPENGTVNISITTDDGYKVENITILAADGTNEVISNDAQTVPFTKDGISVTGPMTISTQLRQYFNVTINYKTIGGTANTGGTVSYGTDIGNAELKTDNSNKIESTGTVEIGANTPFVLFVDPDANYKISSIIRTDARGDETELKPEGSFLNNEAYIDDTLLSIDQNYTYTIQFAPNTYTVTAEASPNGQIEIGEPKRMELTVNHGSEVTVDLTPALDYVVDSITLSEGQVEEEDIRYGEGDKVSFKIKDIQKNVKITVQFKTRPSITYVESGVSFNVESGVRKSNGLYVFKEGTQVVFQAVDGTATDGTITFSNQGLKVKEVEKDEVGGKDTTEVLLSDTDTQIESILVFGTKPGDKIATWYKVDLPDEKIRIAFDTQVPTVTLALPPKESGQTVYTEDVEVTINASDVADNDGDYSGIERIVYKILKDGTEMENGEILADAFTSIISEANQETVEAKLSIPAATYQSGNIEVRVTVVDKAGKESEEKKESLQIHTRPLAVEISVEDRREDEAIENNYQSRTLTITTTDSSYTLDEKKLFESIKIEPASLQSELLDNLEWQEVMNEEGGIGGYKTTINFTKDATYTLTFGSYTNKANQTADITLPENVVLDEFIIDNKQPELEFTLPSFDHPNQDVYNDDVHIKVKMKDEGEPGIGGYTGIKKLVYEIITLNADGQETRKEEIVDAFINVSEDKETGTANAEYTIVVDAETNISESVRVIVTITDKAGNSSRQEITPLKINPTPLKVEIRVDGKQKNYVLKENENENAYYYQSRTVEITTNDTSYTFNEEAFLEAIQFEDESLKTAILGQNGEKIQWDKQDGAYKATLIFPEKDASYQWSFSNYTNKAARTIIQEEVKTEGNHPYEFIIDNTPPEFSLEQTLLEEGQTVYNGDVDVRVTGMEDSGSGIQKVLYKILKDSEGVDQGEIIGEDKYDYENGVTDFENSTFTIKIPAEGNNSSSIRVQVRVVDNAGNMQERKIAHLAINNQIPKVKLSIVSKEHEEAKKTYYNQDCIIKIEVDDADYTLNRKAFEQAIQIEKDGNKIELSEMANYGEWKWVERDKSESGLPYIQLSFRENAQYRLSLGQYKNLANQVAVVEGMNNYEFTVDKTKPNGKLVEADSGDISMQPADSLADLLAIALIKRQPVIYVESPDGDVAKILYYKQKYIENTRPLSENDLEKLYVKGEFEKPEDNFISINSNEEFVVYARITDNAGNTTYLNSNGIIVDILGGKVTITESGVNGSSKSEAGYYNGDVKITITVNDEGMNDIFSGIRKVTAFVYCDGVLKHPVTKEATGIELFAFDKDKNNDGKLEGTVKKEDLITSKIFTAFKLDGITHEFILKGEDYNSDNVRVEVCVKDNAGNPFDDGDGIWAERDKLELKINTTKPTVTVDFGNDITPEIRVEEDIDGKQRGYFQSEKASEAAKEKKATRVAKITITDRASTFDKDNATKEIKKQISAMIYDNDELKTNVELKKLNIDWDSEGDIHTAYVYFVDDGNYNCTWDALGYTNKADNKPGSIVVNGNEPRDVQVAYTFTIDNTLPTGLLKINDTTEIGRWTKAEEETDTEQDKINFFFRNKEIKVTIGGDDAVSPYELYYYQEKAELSTPLSITELNKKFNASAFTKYEHKLLKPDIDTSFNGTAFSVGSLFEGVGYLRVEDYAGNYIYISSEGYVVEDTAPVLTLQPSTPDVLVDGKNINPDPNNPKKFGYYNGDKKLIEVKVNVADLINQVDAYSGIKSVSYTIKKDNDTKITDEGILFPLEGNLPDRMAYDQRKEVFDAIITIDDIGENGRHNSSDLKVEVTAVDNAGNTVTDYVVLDIDTSRPTILVSYDNNNDNGTGSYFDKPRQAIVKVTERKGSFNAQEATAGITIKAVDANGNDIKNPDGTIWDTKTLIGPWQEEEGTDKTGEADRYTQYTTINFIEDATYTLHIEYTDNSGNINQGFSYAPGTIHPEKFTIDKTNPTGTLTATGMNEKSKNSSWNQMVDSLTFDRWSINGITVNGTFEDITSSIQQVDYYKVANNKVLTKEELEWELGDTSVVHTQVQQIPLWQPLILQETNIRSTRTGSIGAITPDEQFTVYMRLKDKAGNTSYISTDGMIVDATAPVVINLIPEGESHAGMEGDLYSGDVNVAVIVEDPITQGDTYSGIDSIEYTISSLGTVTDSNRIEFNQDNRTKGDLQQKYEGSILVDSEQNNSNEVLVEVVVTDNAGNQTKEQLELQIDVTPPEIMISYDNNAPDSDSYYKETRVATISVSERNFDPELVLVDITNTDGPIPVLSNWTESGGGGNGDDTVHSATISYEEDGDYTFEVECTDMADNQAEEITFEPGTVNEKEFTIDQTLPEISVSYDNNDVYNEKYFKEGRVATVTIREHNFVRDRVEFTQTANRGASIPGVSWSSNGDTHTATIPYNSDGDYTFEVTMQDMAGNESEEADYGGSAAGKDFIVDTEISELEITGVENGKAYKDEVVPAVRFSDANFGDYEIKLTRTRRDEIDKDVTEQFIQGMTITGSGGYGTFDTFAEIPENDGIYTLYAKMVDLAGNELEETVTFIINRFGSLYVYSDYLISLIQNGGAYVQEVEEDLVITEYNADRLVAGSLQIEITRDGRPLEEVVYTSSVVYESESGNDEFVAPNGWSQYRYEIAKENFAADGVYKMEVSSKDASGNNPENTNYEDKGILFRVDSTAPELTSVVGLEETIVNANKLDVSYEIYDTIGLKSMKVYVDGKLYGEEITQFEDLSNYAGMFTLNESRAEQSVRLVIEDLAGNITDTDAADFTSVYAFQKKVTISTNALIRLLADRNMLTGVIIAGVAAVIGFWFILFWKRRKKDEEEVGNAK